MVEMRRKRPKSALRKRIEKLDEKMRFVIKEIAGWKCQVCDKDYSDVDSNKRKGFHHHHYFGKGNHFSVRWDLDNALALCWGCHRKFHNASNLLGADGPKDWMKKRLGEDRYERLEEKAKMSVKQRLVADEADEWLHEVHELLKKGKDLAVKEKLKELAA